MRKPLMIVALLTVAFHCLVGCSDGIDMDVVNVNNLNGATGVPIDSKFQYIASPAFDSSTVTGETYFIVPVTGNSASISAKAAMDDTICDLEGALPAAQSSAISTFFGLIPSGVLSYNTQYAICLTEGIAYENGSAFAGFMARFTTAESSSEVTTTLSPADGATGVALDAAVTAVFSGEITEPADWNSSFTLKKDNAGDSLCTSVTYDSATLTATCEHADFEKASNYTASVSGITDIAGAVIGTATAAFAAKTSVVISSINILRLDGVELDLTDRPIPRSARIQYTLGEALAEEADRAAFEAAIAVTDAEGTEVTGTYAWAADYLSTVFTPSSKLGYSTEYTITVDEGSLPVAGLSLNVGVQQTFTTMAYRDINGDGYADAVVDASGVAGGAKNGELYVFLSSGTGGVSDCDLSGSCTADTAILGAAANDLLGHSFSIGDVNADGYADVIVGGVDYWGGPNAGWVYVFLGSAEGIADCDLSGSCTADTTIAAATAGSYLGTSVSAGDVNNDGYDDLIVG
ncbi:MAG: Ig-like domain-containing protein, partial [bacterium]